MEEKSRGRSAFACCLTMTEDAVRHIQGPASKRGDEIHLRSMNACMPTSKKADFADPTRGYPLCRRKAAREPPLPNPPQKAKLKPGLSLKLDKSRGQRQLGQSLPQTGLGEGGPRQQALASVHRERQETDVQCR
jgi:hypothetical protein